MAVLRSRFGKAQRVFLVQKGSDERAGEYEMQVCDYSALSTMSPDWLAASKAAGEWFNSFSGLARYEFNYSVGESMAFVLSHWAGAGEMKAILGSLSDRHLCGDVYAMRIGEPR